MLNVTNKSQLLDIRATIFAGYPIHAKDIPHHSIFQWFRAFLRTAITLCTFDNEGSRVAKHKLGKTQGMHESFESVPSELIILKARRDSAILRAFIRFIFGKRTCFAESLAICAGLRCLGFGSYVIVGFARVEMFAPTQLHAWVECEGKMVSDPDEIKYGYVELQKYC